MHAFNFRPDRIADLVDWVYERDLIRAVKDSTYAPWTRDPVLAGTRFTNPCRKDDKVSQWLVREWYPKVAPRDLLRSAALARLNNWPDSLEGLIGLPFDAEQIIEHLERRMASGKKTWTGAYKVNSGRDPSISRARYVVGQIEQMTARMLDPSSMQNTWINLQTIDGLGPFAAGQIVADLRLVCPGTWADRNTWAPQGPGSRRGIAWVCGWDGKASLPAMSQEQFVRRLRALLVDLLKHPCFVAVFEERGMEMMDVQSCLCEIDKYFRVRAGTGQAKNKYAPPRSAFRPASGANLPA